MKIKQINCRKSFTVFLLFFAFFHFASCGQEMKKVEQKNDLPKHEFKLNAGLLLFEFPELSYEYLLNEESSIGLSLAISIDESIDYNFGIIPYYRLYFSSKYAAGFFIEGNTAVFSENSNFDNNTNAIGVGVGLAIGGKLLSKNGFIGELFIGGGRTLINEEETSDGYPRVGIVIGKRF